MIKEFFAKLTNVHFGSESDPTKERLSKNIQRAHEEAAREAELSRERQRMILDNLPKERRLERLSDDVKTTVKTPEQPSQ